MGKKDTPIETFADRSITDRLASATGLKHILFVQRE